MLCGFVFFFFQFKYVLFGDNNWIDVFTWLHSTLFHCHTQSESEFQNAEGSKITTAHVDQLELIF